MFVRDRVCRLGIVEFEKKAQTHTLARSVPWPRNGRAPKLGLGLSCSESCPAVVASNTVCANCYGAGEFDLCCAYFFLGILVGRPNRLCTDRGASVVRPPGHSIPDASGRGQAKCNRPFGGVASFEWVVGGPVEALVLHWFLSEPVACRSACARCPPFGCWICP